MDDVANDIHHLKQMKKKKQSLQSLQPQDLVEDN